MSSRSLVFPLAVLVLLVAAGPVVGNLGAAHSSADQHSSPGPTVAPDRAGNVALATTGGGATGTATPVEPLAPPEITWTATLESDGDARWEVAVTLPIRNENDSAAFDDIASRFLSGSYSLGLEQFRDNAAAANATTNRSMTINDATRTTDSNESSGELVLSFTWTNFGRVEGDRLVVEDAFHTPAGTWLPDRLDEGWALVIAPPDGYSIVEAPRVENRTARWDGPITFTGDQPRVVFAGETPTPTPTVSPTPTISPTPTVTSPISPTPTPTTPTTPTPTATTNGGPTTTDGPGGSGGLSSLLVFALLVVVAGVAAAGLAYANHEGDGFDFGGFFGGGDGDGDDGDSGTAGSDAAPSGAERSSADASDGSTASAAESTAGTDSGSSGAADDASSAAVAASAATAGADDSESEDESGESEPDEDAVDVELLSDEERVERLIDRNGGRMKQATIVKETGWSNAKVSQLLSAMEDDGRIDKLRIGRENLISYPDEDITDLDSE